MKGRVFDIQRMSVHDGPGIRTTVFLKGCPLRCLWCHNPESQRAEAELSFTPALCVGCGECAAVCPRHCHILAEGAHRIDRAACARCGRCAAACTGALRLIGREMTADEVLEVVLRDAAFYRNSGGGLTVSGGEPLSQPEFARQLLCEAREAGLHTCLETSGYAPWEAVSRVSEAVDLMLYDYKETDPGLHRAFVGADNGLILDNLRRLDERGRALILRCPIVPGCNDREDHFRGIAETANRLSHVQAIHIEPYNRLGQGKSEAIGREYPLPDTLPPEDDTVAAWLAQVRRHTDVPVVKS